MLSFENDYNRGAHPAILKKLADTNMDFEPGYGEDSLCRSAADKIRAACALPDADVFFIAGGTQTNQVVISSLLRSYEGVIAADTGHVSLHEAGAIEYSGHKVIQLPGKDGKLSASDVAAFFDAFNADESHEHMVFGGMVYISFPTEYGTLYSRGELSELHRVCRDNGVPLFIDGARLAYGLTSAACDVDLPTLAASSDVFYIGGTKVGALIGEALVFSGMKAPEHFITLIKQRGALLAKGRLLGAQFDALFTDGLYFELGRRANAAALRLRQILLEHGLTLFLDSPTNQQFFVIDNARAARLRQRVAFSFWEPFDGSRSVVRFASSWATSDDDLAALESALAEC